MFTDYFEPTPEIRSLAEYLTRGMNDRLTALKRISRLRTTRMPDGMPILTYTSDIAQFGVSEYWEPPDVTLRNRSGDCESGSFLIAAMDNSLPEHLSSDENRIVVGIYNPLGVIPIIGEFVPEYHAWVESRVGNRWYISDWIADVFTTSPDRRFKPIFAVYPHGIVMFRRVL